MKIAACFLSVCFALLSTLSFGAEKTFLWDYDTLVTNVTYFDLHVKQAAEDDLSVDYVSYTVPFPETTKTVDFLDYSGPVTAVVFACNDTQEIYECSMPSNVLEFTLPGSPGAVTLLFDAHDDDNNGGEDISMALPYIPDFWWRLDETAGTIAYNTGSYGTPSDYNATLQLKTSGTYTWLGASEEWGSGGIVGGIDLDSTYIHYGYSLKINNELPIGSTGKLTIAFWSTNDYSPGSAGGTIFYHGYHTSQSNNIFSVASASTSHVIGGNVVAEEPPGSPSGSSWSAGTNNFSSSKTHVAIVVDFDANYIYIYVNGVLVQSYYKGFGDVFADHSNFASVRTAIGGLLNSAGQATYLWNGKIADVRVWVDKAATAEEVYAIYENKHRPLRITPDFRWKLDETIGTVAYNTGSYGTPSDYNGTVFDNGTSIFLWFGGTETWGSGGVTGGIGLFPAADTIADSTGIDIDTNLPLDGLKKMTLTCWSENGGGGSQDGRLFFNGRTWNETGHVVMLGYSGFEDIRTRINGDTQLDDAGNEYTTEKVHWSMVIDYTLATEQLKLYKNGVKVYTVDDLPGTEIDESLATDGSGEYISIIGASTGSSNAIRGNSFYGAIADMRIWMGEAATDAEIEAIYNNSLFNLPYVTGTATNDQASAVDGFIARVDLAPFPTEFWTINDTSDATKGRVFLDDGTELASDWIAFDNSAETGEVWFKVPGSWAASSTVTVRIVPPLFNNDSYAADHVFGSQNVWEGLVFPGVSLPEDSRSGVPDIAVDVDNGNPTTGYDEQFGPYVDFSNDGLITDDDNYITFTTNSTKFSLILNLALDSISFNGWHTIFDIFQNTSNFLVLYAMSSSSSSVGVPWGSASNALVLGYALTADTQVDTWFSDDEVLTENSTFQRVIVTYDGTQSDANKVTMYVNGEDAGASLHFNGTSNTGSINPTPFNGMRIGDSGWGSEYIDGKIGGFRYTTGLILTEEYAALDFQQYENNEEFWGGGWQWVSGEPEVVGAILPIQMQRRFVQLFNH